MSKSKKHDDVTTNQSVTVVAETKTEQLHTYDVAGLLVQFGNKSKVIRYLAAQGETVNNIHKILVGAGWVSKNGTPIRYQHVRNVLKQEPKKKSTAATNTNNETQVQTSSVDAATLNEAAA